MVTNSRLGLRPNEAARALGVGRDRIFDLIASGELKSAKVGRSRIIPMRELEAFLERKVAEQEA